MLFDSVFPKFIVEWAGKWAFYKSTPFYDTILALLNPRHIAKITDMCALTIFKLISKLFESGNF